MKKLLAPLAAVVAVAILASCTPSNLAVESGSAALHLGRTDVTCELLAEGGAFLADGRRSDYKADCWSKSNPRKKVIVIAAYKQRNSVISADVRVSAPSTGGSLAMACHWTNASGKWRTTGCTRDEIPAWAYWHFVNLRI